MAEATDLAEAVIGGLQDVGVRVFCVCAGARNSGLIAALSDLRGDGVRVYRFVDERCAGFFAVGSAARRTEPVAVLTTSGTAVAELLPAAIEAHYRGLPLILASADRPRRYRGSGAPQTIDQVGIFSGFVDRSVDLATPLECEGVFDGWEKSGPLHLNVCCEEPGEDVVPDGHPGQLQNPLPRPFRPAIAGGGRDPREEEGRLVVLVGDLPPLEVGTTEGFLHTLGAPVWAEATSGLRESPELEALLIRGGDATLKRARFERVLRIGGVPSCRFWRDLEDRLDVAVLSVTPTGYPGLSRPSVVVNSLAEVGGAERFGGAGDAGWKSVDDEGAGRLTRALSRFPRSEAALMRRLSESVDEGAAVLLGNSLPIREWNLCATSRGRGLRCSANRGANGIDGLLSTFFGIAENEPVSWAIVGDLSAFYDMGAPWVAPQLPAGKRVIVVINNGGGKIFSRLPALEGLPGDAREWIENPHTTSFDRWAHLWGWAYLRCDREIPNGLEMPDKTVLEIVPDEYESEAFWQAL